MEFDPFSPLLIGLGLVGYVFVTCALYTLCTRVRLELARHDLVRESRLLRKQHMAKLTADAQRQQEKSSRAAPASLVEHRAAHAAPTPPPKPGHGHGRARAA